MRSLAAVAVLSMLAACQAPPPETPQADTAQMEAEARQEITERWDAYQAMAADMDLETWLSYWTPSARLLEPGMDLSGGEIPEFGAEFFNAGGEVFSMTLESFEIWVHGDVAYQLGQYDEAFQFPGEDPAEVQNYFFARWEKVEGTWMIDRLLAGPRGALPEG